MITQTGPNGEPLNFSALDRGIYKEFPSDLDSGLPLEYDIKRETVADGDADVLGTAGVSMGGGSGARIYLTSRFIPDCSQKGNALKDLGLEEGVYPPLPINEHIAETINDYPIFGPDGFPLFGAEVIEDDNGFQIIKVGGPDIDGLRWGDDDNPGLLDLLGILPGDYIKDPLPTAIKINDNVGGSDTFGFVGPQEINTSAGDVEGGNAGMYQYTLLDLAGNNTPRTNDTEKRLNVDGLVLKSLRYPTPPTGYESMANVWIDQYDTNGWAYLEANTVIRKQEKLVDTKRITDIITYDEETAHKEYDIDLYDPFKGVIPGFIGKDINHRSVVDPCVYDPTKTTWGRNQVGKTWWMTLNSIYQWYEQGSGAYGISRYVDGGIEKIGYNNTERAIGWGELFPNAKIEIFEWIESLDPPSQYSGVGAPKNSIEFIQEEHVDPRSGKTLTYYYYWVRGLYDVNDEAKQKYGRTRSTADLERLLEDPYAERIAFAGIVSPDGIIVNTLSDLIKTDESILSINFKRKDPIASQKHTSWRLIGEGDPQENIPENLSLKLLDSLAGYNAVNQTVPAKGLSNAERYGSNFRPNQTMFKNLKDARKQMFDALNEIFKEVKMDSTFLDWRKNLPTTLNYLDTVNWFEKLRKSGVDNSQLYYNEDYKPLRKVTDTKQFDLLKDVLDKSIIQVQKNSTSRYELYEYSKATDTFKLISKENETVQWKSTVYSDVQTQALGMEIRQVLYALYKNIFVGSGSEYWNKFFFKMMKHAYAEQGELDWAFKSTYLKVEKEETDLIPFKGFKVDNFDKAIDYFNEVKPYSSKIRNYSDIKKTPVEVIKGTTSDFDRPPYFDEETKEVRILDDSVTADLNILQSNASYTGFYNSSSLARTSNTTIVFDRVKGDLFENTTGGKSETIIADGSSAGFSFNIDVEDVDRLKVFVNKKLIPITSTGNSVTVTNYTVNTDNGFLTFESDMSLNPAVGIPDNGTAITLEYFDGYDPTSESLNVSIAQNIVNIESNANINISNVQQKWTAPEKIWKYDPLVRSEIAKAFDLVYGDGSSANASIIQNVSIVTAMVNSGNLTPALNLVKRKVGANFQGRELDASVFTDIVPGTHSTTFYTDTRGWDVYGFDTETFDKQVDVENFIGVFNESTQGNVNYRVDDSTYYGFDSVTFSKATHGPDRPEELIVVQPFETLVMDVTTKPQVFFTDATKTVTTSNTTSFTETVGTNSAEVRFKIFQDLFGRSDYYRQTVEAATTTTANLEIFDNEISVVDASTLPEASEINPAAIWVQGERITYELRDTASNKLKGIVRGTRGTTPNTLIVSGAEVRNGQETENIKLVSGDGVLIRDPELYNWIRPVQIFDDQVPFDDDFDGTGGTSGFQNGVQTLDGDTGDLLYDVEAGNTSVRSDGGSVSQDGFDAHFDENKIANGQSYDGQIIEAIGGNTYILYHDINLTDGFDSGSKGVKDAISITDKGSVLEANTSIIDFLHNFNNN